MCILVQLEKKAKNICISYILPFILYCRKFCIVDNCRQMK